MNNTNTRASKLSYNSRVYVYVYVSRFAMVAWLHPYRLDISREEL